jgi:UDP:flavonoid glycosyltransferase YjiC (YdhE family)
MARILAVTWDGGGNVPPMLGIARELQQRGHEVRVLGHAGQHRAITSAGLAFREYRHAHPWSPDVEATGLRFLARFLFGAFTDPGPGRDVREELAREPVDLALVDSMSLAGLRAAEQAGVPTAVLMHTLRRYHTHQWSRGPLGVVATLRGMRPGALWNRADRVLVATDRELEPAATETIPANVRYTGVVQAPIAPGRREEPPVVLVSLSSIYFEGQDKALQNIVDAMEGLPIRALVTTGAVAPQTLRAPANVELHRFLPHDEIMPSVSLVVGHGGHSTTMRALAHGIPLLILPMHPLLDQPMIGQAIAAAGAGRALPKSASPAQIRSAVQALLADRTYRDTAETIGLRLRSQSGAVAAADELEAMLEAG